LLTSPLLRRRRWFLSPALPLRLCGWALISHALISLAVPRLSLKLRING
jgi:hypothetical protein